jgi:hypothetical protein
MNLGQRDEPWGMVWYLQKAISSGEFDLSFPEKRVKAKSRRRKFSFANPLLLSSVPIFISVLRK